MGLVRKIWVGIGAATVAPAFGASAITPTVLPVRPDAAIVHTIDQNQRPGQQGIVGGETYLRDGGVSDTRTRIARDLILLHGHALIADEAVAAGDWVAALRHLTDASEELRAKVEPYMRGQGLGSFAPIIANLTKAIGTKDSRGYAAARRAYDALAERAVLAIKKFQTPHLRFQMRAAVEALKAAASAYDAALSGQTIGDVAEYRDSRGFFLAADRAIQALAPELAKVQPLHLRDIQKHLAELKTAWPMFAPPATIVMSADGVALLVSKIEDEAAIYWQSF